MKPTLYLLLPTRDDPPVVCSECALIEGLLVHYPAIEDAVDVKRVGFHRPRPELIAALGEAHQGAPVLVFPAGTVVPQAALQAPTGLYFLSGPDAISEYFAGMGLAGRLAS